MATDKPRYTVSVDQELFDEIENFRYSNRYSTRSEATVELIEKGITALNQSTKPLDASSTPESDAELQEKKAINLPDQYIEYFNRIDEDGQELIKAMIVHEHDRCDMSEYIRSEAEEKRYKAEKHKEVDTNKKIG